MHGRWKTIVFVATLSIAAITTYAYALGALDPADSPWLASIMTASQFASIVLVAIIAVDE